MPVRFNVNEFMCIQPLILTLDYASHITFDILSIIRIICSFLKGEDVIFLRFDRDCLERMLTTLIFAVRRAVSIWHPYHAFIFVKSREFL